MDIFNYIIKNIIPNILSLFEIILLFTALRITIGGSVKDVILAYRWQSWLLAGITGLSALVSWANLNTNHGTGSIVFLLLLIVALPALLGRFIKEFLVRATITLPSRRPFPTQDEVLTAERIWLRQEGKGNSVASIAVFGALVALAFWIAFLALPAGTFYPFTFSERIGLMVSLSLHLVGLYNTSVKRDIISQSIGLLTMDHGLYLAVVKIVSIPVPATFFVISLYFYTLITVFLIVILLPRVRQMTGAIDLDKIESESTLKG
jgi:hydrogenase-4 membrane subunit HyfE